MPSPFSVDLRGWTVLVTGATGFIGVPLVQALVEAGAAVRLLVRASSRLDGLTHRGLVCEEASADAPPACRVFRGGFEDLDGLRAACDGAHAVVHAAGGGKVESVEAFYAHNRDTTVHLAQAALEAAPGLRAFVLVSSAAAHGPATAGRPAVETDPPAPGSHYGKSKRAAEEALVALSDRLPVRILRPPAVYGPGDTRMVGLFSAVHRGLLPVIGDGETSLVHVDDVVQAILRLTVARTESGRAFFVSDGEVYSRQRMGAALEAAFGREALRIPVPASLLRGVAAASERIASLTGRSTFLTRDKVQDLLQPSWAVSPERLCNELGYTPTVRFEEGAKATARWYLKEGWL